MANIQIDGARISATKVREYLLHLADLIPTDIQAVGSVDQDNYGTQCSISLCDASGNGMVMGIHIAQIGGGLC